jgi:hypothetical protein
MRKRRKKESSKEREEYRQGLGSRLVERHGDVGVVARAADSDPATIWSWRQPGEGLPDVFQLALIAEAKRVSPAWLAFAQGPRDPQLAEQGLGLAAEVERNPGLKEVIAAYCRGSEEDRAGMRWAASKVEAGLLESFGGQGGRGGMEGRGIGRKWKEGLPLFGVSGGARRRGVSGLPEWLVRATGAEGVLEVCGQRLQLRGLEGESGVFCARVRGEAMQESLVAGDVVVLRAAAGGGIKLERCEGSGRANAVARTRVDVTDDSVWVLQVNDEAPTVRRVRYYAGGGEWHVMLQADNALEPGYPRIVTRQDEVTFWARVIGLVREG